MLKIGSFKTVYPGASGIKWLGHPASDRLGAGCSTKRSRSQDRLVENDGVCQVLIEISSRDNSKRIYVVLHEHIDVIRSLRLEIWVSQAYELSCAVSP